MSTRIHGVTCHINVVKTSHKDQTFYARSQNCDKWVLALSCSSVRPSVCSSVRMEQLGSHLTDFDDTLYLGIFRSSIEKIQVSIKSDKNNGYHADIFTFMIISLWILLRMRNISNKSCSENQNTRFMFSNLFSGSRAETTVFNQSTLRNNPKHGGIQITGSRSLRSRIHVEMHVLPYLQDTLGGLDGTVSVIDG